MSAPHKLLGQVLLEMGLVDERKVNEALEHQRRVPGTKIGQAMLDLGFLDEIQLTKALCRQFRLPFVDLTRASPSRDVIDLVPRDVVENYGIVPVKMHQGKLIIATDDPTPVGDEAFASNFEGIRTYVFLHGDSRSVGAVSCQATLCNDGQIRALADRVASRL